MPWGMAMINPLEKATASERAAAGCTDPDRVLYLTSLRDLWLVVAKEKLGGAPDWHVEAAKLEELHATAFGSTESPARSN
jgi:hypothetical protein